MSNPELLRFLNRLFKYSESHNIFIKYRDDDGNMFFNPKFAIVRMAKKKAACCKEWANDPNEPIVFLENNGYMQIFIINLGMTPPQYRNPLAPGFGIGIRKNGTNKILVL